MSVNGKTFVHRGTSGRTLGWMLVNEAESGRRSVGQWTMWGLLYGLFKDFLNFKFSAKI